jgi:teichuronic acid biosynthesis glycosyltransferase TuaG
MTLVSIIMPTYNSARFVRRAIESVMRQTCSCWELLVVDDCSSDDTVAIIEALAAHDNRIKPCHLDSHKGAAGARNEAIVKATGEYIAFLDSDDCWLPEKLEKQIAFMRKTGSCFSYTASQRICDDSDSPGGRSYIVKVPQQVCYRDILKFNSITCSSVLIDARAVGRPRMPEIRMSEDFALWLQILKEFEYAHGLDEVCVLYMVRRGSVSFNKVIAAFYVWRVYREVEKLKLLTALYYFLQYIFLWCKSKLQNRSCLQNSTLSLDEVKGK